MSNADALVELLNACEALGPWVSASLDNQGMCEEYRTAADAFLTAYLNVNRRRVEIQAVVARRLADKAARGTLIPFNPEPYE